MICVFKFTIICIPFKKLYFIYNAYVYFLIAKLYVFSMDHYFTAMIYLHFLFTFIFSHNNNIKFTLKGLEM